MLYKTIALALSMSALSFCAATAQPSPTPSATPSMMQNYCATRTERRIIFCNPPGDFGIRVTTENVWFTEPAFGTEFLAHFRIKVQYDGGTRDGGRSITVNASDFEMLVGGQIFSATTQWDEQFVAQNERFGEGLYLLPGQSAERVLTFGLFEKSAYPDGIAGYRIILPYGVHAN